MVTAELAVAVPVVVLLLALTLSGVAALSDQVRVVDAARLAARALARGDEPASAVALAVRAAPPGSRVEVATRDGVAVVTVHVRAGALGGLLAGWTVSGTGVTPVERVGQVGQAGP